MSSTLTSAASSPAATTSTNPHLARELNRASFEGVMISALAYGMRFIS